MMFVLTLILFIGELHMGGCQEWRWWLPLLIMICMCRWVYSCTVWVRGKLWGGPHANPTFHAPRPPGQPTHVLWTCALQDHQLPLVCFFHDFLFLVLPLFSLWSKTFGFKMLFIESIHFCSHKTFHTTWCVLIYKSHHTLTVFIPYFYCSQ